MAGNWQALRVNLFTLCRSCLSLAFVQSCFSDTDSDATPSGYLSEPDDDSMETIETTTVDDQER
jgi:hypothetical protein